MKRDRQGGIRVYVKTCCANAGNGDVGGECDVYQVPNEYVRDYNGEAAGRVAFESRDLYYYVYYTARRFATMVDSRIHSRETPYHASIQTCIGSTSARAIYRTNDSAKIMAATAEPVRQAIRPPRRTCSGATKGDFVWFLALCLFMFILSFLYVGLRCHLPVDKLLELYGLSASA